MTRIHNIGHIHNANFVQTQFSTSHPQKQHFLKSWKFTFLWKYSVCGLKFEISEYPIKLLYVTYSPYQYELERIKTHEMRAKNFPPFFFSVHGMVQKKTFFEGIFFSNTLRKFSMCRLTMFNILEGCPISYFYARKKIILIWHTNQKISTKTRFTSEKKTVQRDFPFYHCNILFIWLWKSLLRMKNLEVYMVGY